jgi:very-short-patch-repair endonuclease
VSGIPASVLQDARSAVRSAALDPPVDDATLAESGSGIVRGMASRVTRDERARRATRVAELHAGVAHRADLRAVGLSRHDVASEVAAGRWSRAGRHTVVIGTGSPFGEALLWQAVWESGPGAVLDGPAALLAAGMTGYRVPVLDVALPARNRGHVLPGVRLHRRRDVGPVIAVGLPRLRPEAAAVHAAQWARSDRQAALVLCLVVQQRLVPPGRLIAYWRTVTRSTRRPFIDAVVRDVCDGATSLGELDFARLCRTRGLPQPTRQVVRVHPSGRVYLDVAWDDIGLVVEIDGGHHALALNPVDDALRENEIVLGSERVLRIPVLGLRLTPDAFLDQVVRAHRQLGRGVA